MTDTPNRFTIHDWLLILWCLAVFVFVIWSIAAHGQTVQLSPGPVLLTSLPVVQP